MYICSKIQCAKYYMYNIKHLSYIKNALKSIRHIQQKFKLGQNTVIKVNKINNVTPKMSHWESKAN